MAFLEDLIYAAVLISSIGAGLFVRSIHEQWQKQLMTCLIGFFTTLALCGSETLHTVAIVAGTLVIIKSHSRQTPLLAFIFVFSYVLFFRCAPFFGLPKPSAVGNAVQLLLTLKLISVAIEIHDFRQRKKHGEKKDDTRFQLSLDEEPTLYDVVCYSYCFVGLFTGPFFKYRTYLDFLQQTPKQVLEISWKIEVTYRVKHAVIFSVLFLSASQFFSVEYVKMDQFYDRSFWFRLLYMVPIFFIARMRFYVAWLLAECSCITAGLGAYPKESKPRPGHGPTVDIDDSDSRAKDPDKEIEYSFETIRNINPSGSDWSKTVRDGMRNWNMSVQWWLANYVHKRWPANLKQFRTAAVLAVSAYWHGIAPGYFGAFLTMPFVMLAEDLMAKMFRNKLSPDLQQGYDWVNWFFKMRSFEYMFMAFALLTWEDTYRWWKSVYFIGHVGCFLLILLCMMSRKVFRPPKSVPLKEE